MRRFKSTKPQHPTSRETSRTKLQWWHRYCLKFGTWDLFGRLVLGAWMLSRFVRHFDHVAIAQPQVGFVAAAAIQHPFLLLATRFRPARNLHAGKVGRGAQ